MNFKKIVNNYKNITTVSDPTQFYCEDRGCVKKTGAKWDEWDWECPTSVKHYSQRRCICNEEEGYVNNDAKTSCNYQCTIDGTDARKQPDNSKGAENYFSWNKIGENNYCVRYQPSMLHSGVYDPKIYYSLDAGPVGYCTGSCNGNINAEQSLDLSQKGFSFTTPQCGWDNNDCYANIVDTTTIPQPTYHKTSPVTYLYAQNIKTNIPAPNDQPTVCFSDMKPSSTQYKNLSGKSGDLFDPRFKYSHPYPKITSPATVTSSNLCHPSAWINPPIEYDHLRYNKNPVCVSPYSSSSDNETYVKNLCEINPDCKGYYSNEYNSWFIATDTDPRECKDRTLNDKWATFHSKESNYKASQFNLGYYGCQLKMSNTCNGTDTDNCKSYVEPLCNIDPNCIGYFTDDMGNYAATQNLTTRDDNTCQTYLYKPPDRNDGSNMGFNIFNRKRY
jgi:hypothetical protein